ncbi:DNA replication/repair protein RecF [Neptunicella sp. SCSIO 80796]|uniref:DNA replication/repair protein RecF n=1 Tax=Neptunicella plasticusilytica TaxID=3117012 RepID=UPI003A4D8F14
MKLDKVQIQHFRNLSNVSLQPSANLNVFVGKNGSGKTSFLEALYYLSYGRSFRTSKYQSLISAQHQQFVLFSSLNEGNSESDLCKIGMMRNRHGDIDIKINGDKQSRISTLGLKMPTQIFTPQSSDLLIGSPGLRRSYMDWGLFHVEQFFLNDITLFNRVLKQRNAMLKGNYDRQQNLYWTDQLLHYGETVSSHRQKYVEIIKPYIDEQIKQFLPEFSIEIAYHRGWEKGLDLAQALAKHNDKDKLYGHSTIGPHKADLRLKVDSRAVQEVLSRGQLRVLTAAMQIAQSKLLFDKRKLNCIHLLDDLAAELDIDKRTLFIRQLLETKAQIFVTATEKQQVAFLDSNISNNIKMFHVEHGQVNEEKAING